MNGRIALAKNFQLFLLYHVFIHVDCALLTSHKLVFAFLLALNQHIQYGNIEQGDVNTYLSLGIIFDYLKVKSMYMRERKHALDDENIDDECSDYPLFHSTWLGLEAWLNLKKMKNVKGLSFVINSLK